MTPQEIIEAVETAGGHFVFEVQNPVLDSPVKLNRNTKLRVRAPRGTLTPHLQEAIRENKEAIVALLEKRCLSFARKPFEPLNPRLRLYSKHPRKGFKCPFEPHLNPLNPANPIHAPIVAPR
jgi:hypothetical protein